MFDQNVNNELIKKTLETVKTVAMVGVSSIKEKEDLKNIKRRPSVIVMQYLQEFGYKVIPVNPNSVGKKVCGETIFSKLEDISSPIDVVNVFRPSKEAPEFARQAVKVKAKVLWLQYGIESQEAKEIANSSNIIYTSELYFNLQGKKRRK